MIELPADYTKMNSRERRAVREAYIEKQGQCCYHCKGSIIKDPPKEILNKKIMWKAFPPNFLKYPVHLHHCHNTGITIGAVHAYCNAVLWQYHGE